MPAPVRSLLSALRILIATIGVLQFAVAASAAPSGRGVSAPPAEPAHWAAEAGAELAILTSPPVIAAVAKVGHAGPAPGLAPAAVPKRPEPVLTVVRTGPPGALPAATPSDAPPPARGPPFA